MGVDDEFVLGGGEGEEFEVEVGAVGEGEVVASMAEGEGVELGG